MAINVAPWIKEDCITTGTGALVLTAASSTSFIRFNAAIGNGDTVYYAILDANGNRESGVGTFDGTATVTRDRITATLNGTTYNDTNPVALTLSGSSVVICSFTEAAYDDLVTLINLAARPVQHVIVSQASDLAGVLDSTVVYIVDGQIDMGTQSIAVPSGGLHIKGLGSGISALTSTAVSYTMFTGAVLGDVFLSDLAITVSGTSSRVYNLSNTGVHDITTNVITYLDCTSLGTLTSFKQANELNVSRIGGTPNLIFSGTWTSGYRGVNSRAFGLVSGAYGLFEEGASFTMTSNFTSDINADLPATTTLCTFVPANFINTSSFQFRNASITRNGVITYDDTSYLPNILISDLASSFRNNEGINNTHEGGHLHVTAETTTTVAVSNTYYDLLGTYTASELQHFSMTNNGQLRQDGSSPVEYKITFEGTIVGTALDVISVKLVRYVAATTSFEDVEFKAREINNAQSGTDLFYITLFAFTQLYEGDYIKIQAENQTLARDVTLQTGSELIIEAR